ncbi:hypothetical protein D8771_10105 [Streptomyces albus]|uniref:Uncharacterized protein n=1 Tax=Streptomyces albus TaxID=1888 RepID=A0A8H1LMF7_9ACTN|nr:hypothetical protein ADL27_10610 [Streptomyces sp. NRRL F-6602]TGG85519.1 hypothetical protein D8771_10105 [Streptomyces albus]
MEAVHRRPDGPGHRRLSHPEVVPAPQRQRTAGPQLHPHHIHDPLGQSADVPGPLGRIVGLRGQDVPHRFPQQPEFGAGGGAVRALGQMHVTASLVRGVPDIREQQSARQPLVVPLVLPPVHNCTFLTHD